MCCCVKNCMLYNHSNQSQVTDILDKVRKKLDCLYEIIRCVIFTSSSLIMVGCKSYLTWMWHSSRGTKNSSFGHRRKEAMLQDSQSQEHLWQMHRNSKCQQIVGSMMWWRGAMLLGKNPRFFCELKKTSTSWMYGSEVLLQPYEDIICCTDIFPALEPHAELWY